MSTPSIEDYRRDARTWLAANAEPRPAETSELAWGEGPDSVAVFHDLSAKAELAGLRAQGDWQARKYAAGYGAIDLPAAHGGAGLSKAHATAFAIEEAAFVTPP